jgi:hypothetical protein
MFLVNHWLSDHNPGLYNKVNSREELTKRLRRCVEERGRVPNVIAVDFSGRGDLVGTARAINAELLDQYRQLRGAAHPPAIGATTTSTAPASATGSAPTGPLLPPISQATPIRTLTGGDPAAFCPAVPAANRAANVWALASFVATPSSRGLPDLAFGPLVVRDLGRAYAVAPQELAQQGALALARARAAVESLRTLGFDQESIDRLADRAADEAASPDNPDPVVVQQRLVDELGRQVGTDRVNAAAAAFASANPEPPGLFDLGDVSPEVASAYGYQACVG